MLGPCSQRATGGRIAMSSRFAASSRRSAASALGTAGPGARAVLAERDLGAARHVPLLHRQSKKKRGVGFGYCRARCSARACIARLEGGWPYPLASPPDKAEIRRRLLAPPSQWLRRCMQSASRGQLAMTSRLPLVREVGRLRLWAPPEARSVLATRDKWNARQVKPFRR